MKINNYYQKRLVMAILLGLMASCYQEKKQDNIVNMPINPAMDSINIVDSTSMPPIDFDTVVSYQQPQMIEQPTPVVYTKYGFVIFDAVGFMDRAEVYCTGIVELPSNMSEDDKYKFLDEAQSGAMKYKVGTTVTGRELKIYDSYAEASKAREEILGYR